MKERLLGLLGRKLGMTTIYDAQGIARGVTVVALGPCRVLGKRTLEQHGYRALVLGFGEKKAKKLNRAEAGLYKKLGLPLGEQAPACAHISEFRVGPKTLEKFAIGQTITLSDLGLQESSYVDVTSTSIGKGFAGVMKRHHFAGFRASHGTHEYFRHGGSIGCRKWPGRVFKGRKMPGHMGNRQVTTQNIRVLALRPQDNAVLLHGSVPGCKNAVLRLRPAIKLYAEAI